MSRELRHCYQKSPMSCHPDDKLIKLSKKFWAACPASALYLLCSDVTKYFNNFQLVFIHGEIVTLYCTEYSPASKL